MRKRCGVCAALFAPIVLAASMHRHDMTIPEHGPHVEIHHPAPPAATARAYARTLGAFAQVFATEGRSMTAERFEELYQAKEAADAAVRAHWASLNVSVWYGDGPNASRPRGTRTYDAEWRAEHRALRAARDAADDRLNVFMGKTRSVDVTLKIEQAPTAARPPAELSRAFEPPKPNRAERRQRK